MGRAVCRALTVPPDSLTTLGIRLLDTAQNGIAAKGMPWPNSPLQLGPEP